MWPEDSIIYKFDGVVVSQKEMKCFVLGHQWAASGTHPVHEAHLIVVTATCTRCGAIKQVSYPVGGLSAQFGAPEQLEELMSESGFWGERVDEESYARMCVWCGVELETVELLAEHEEGCDG